MNRPIEMHLQARHRRGPRRPAPRAASRSAPRSSSTARCVAVGHNRRVQQGSAIQHGETDCLENAGRLPAVGLRRATMVTTLSPCDMCTGAILLYGIPRVVIGENRTFFGGEDLLRSRGVEVVVLDDAECVAMMTEFIAANPDAVERGHRRALTTALP